MLKLCIEGQEGKEKTHFPPQPCSQGSLLPALRMAGRRKPWERGCSLELNSIFV